MDDRNPDSRFRRRLVPTPDAGASARRSWQEQVGAGFAGLFGSLSRLGTRMLERREELGEERRKLRRS